MTERPEEAVRRAKDALAWTLQPDAPWSILLEAMLATPLPALMVTDRFVRALLARPALGPPPEAHAIAASDLEATRWSFANEPYVDGGPTIRAAVTDGERPVLLLAAHHGALDGLGLVAALGVALDAPVTSTARGVRAEGQTAPTPTWIAQRLAEAAFAPPARVQPTRRAPSQAGDLLLATEAPLLTGGTPALVAAAVRALRSWNAGSKESGRPAVVGIGASNRPGHTPTLEHAGAWLRIRVDDASLAATREQLANATAEPVGHIRALRYPLTTLGRAVAARLGSTFVVSNLSALGGSRDLRSATFYPKAHGRSAVSLGAVTVGTQTRVSLRVRACDFSPTDAQRFLRSTALELESLDAGRPPASPDPVGAG